MILLVDIGNTRLKWALAHDGELRHGEAMDYRLPEFVEHLTQAWTALKAPRKLAIASVASPAVFEAVSQILNRLWSDSPLFIARTGAYALGVRNGYQQPERLGVDRWLALLGAHRYHCGNVCIVDCGTAITVDVLAADGRHRGGLIAPGLTTMRKSLASEAAALVLDDATALPELAFNTRDAIANGSLMAAIGLISTTLSHLSDDYRLLLTGGDAERLATALPSAMIDEGLVFKGLAALADEEWLR